MSGRSVLAAFQSFGFIALLSIMLSATGCARLPCQSGAWIGTPMLITLRDSHGIPYYAWSLRIQSGTRLGDGGLKHWYGDWKSDLATIGATTNDFLCPSPLLINRNHQLLQLENYTGHRLRVKGRLDNNYFPSLMNGNLKISESLPEGPFGVGALVTSKWKIIDLGSVALIAGTNNSSHSDVLASFVNGLSAEGGLWVNGLDQNTVPDPSSPGEVVSVTFRTADFQTGHVTHYKVLETRRVHIGEFPDPYIAVLVETNLGKMIVLMQHERATKIHQGDWWRRIYDTSPEIKRLY